ncbi:DNA repair protein rhp26 [Coemansia sp. RSA 2131]|nr:DNA repair protein rhp26 [Coemansia sp. RSA 2131]
MSNSEDTELAQLGAQIVEHSQLERTVQSRAAHDLATHQTLVNDKRKTRITNALAKKREQLDKARDQMERAKPQSTRFTNAVDKVDRLEEEIEQLQRDFNEVTEVPRIKQELAAMVVPRRQAAVRAEMRGFGVDEGEESDHDAYEPDNDNTNQAESGDDAYEPDCGDDVENELIHADEIVTAASNNMDDDGDEAAYQQRVYEWCTARWNKRYPNEAEDTDVDVEGDSTEASKDAQLQQEPFLADPDTTDYEIRAHERTEPSLRVPRQIWSRLLEYQRAGVRWMFTLHQQRAGGILGDEMGLGKTVQTAAFLASLYHSRMLSRPSIIVCPATLMRQWVRELHTWWPVLRVAIMHNTGVAMKTSVHVPGSGLADLQPDAASEPSDAWEAARMVGPQFGVSEELSGYDSSGDYEYDAYGSRIRRKRKPRGTLDWRKRMKKKKQTKRPSSVSKEGLERAQRLIDHVQQHGHILVVTYTGLQMYNSLLLQHAWGYAVLDEGHMIRNPDAEATLACKQLNTRHRLLVTGTPIQNNLTELWSLFDFIFPGRLGTLPVFTNQFAVPITTGGFANATQLQVRAAYQCACVLRDLIDPYLLRRLKADVARDLPKKTEHVVFCRLTRMQRSAYLGFLQSNDMERILGGRLQMLFGVDVARKICDHPDLLLLSTMASASAMHRQSSYIAHNSGAANNSGSDSDVDVDRDALPPDYGDYQKSGKMTIVRALLDMWKPQGHKVLIFSQTRQMLDIIERMVSQMPNTQYRRMDGTTPIQNRTALVDEFNTNKDVFVFLLTTKVGGLGINLTGADRVILYSPDWNPSSDMQARERAWRLGQQRNVAIYRLMTAGTIEEKIYNRQIYKQFLSSKILDDPAQKRVFQSHSMQDLFSLADFDESETGNVQKRVVAHGSAEYEDVSENEDELVRVTETGRMFANAQLHPRLGGSEQSATVEDSVVTANDAQCTGGQIESIGGVVRLEPYTNSADEHSEQPSDAGDTGEADEDRVLQSLFKMSGMHSALQHDAIVNNRDDSGLSVIDQEATRIARDARSAVRESQRARRQMDVRVPTWTGASGQAGIPSGSVAPPPVLERNVDEMHGMRAVSKSRRKPLLMSVAPTHGISAKVDRERGSANLLAGLRAKNANMDGGRSSSGSTWGLNSGSTGELRRVGDPPVGANTHRSDAVLLRPPRRAVVQTPRQVHPTQAATTSQSHPELSERDKQTVRRIRQLLTRNNGEIGNKLLMDEFSSEFPYSEQPRLKQLASTVADQVVRKLAPDRTGVGRIVQKVWRLKRPL